MASLSHTHLPAQRLQMTTQRLMEAQSGWGAPQSAQNLLGAAAQMRSATSEVDRASAMAPCMASSHCSFSTSESAEKLWTHKEGTGRKGLGDWRVRGREERPELWVRTGRKVRTKKGVMKTRNKGESRRNRERKGGLGQVIKGADV